MKKLLSILTSLFVLAGLQAQPSRTEFRIPDILGYKALKCDLHIHTVFSDGLVWPTYRVDEAWQEGLDAIAITDHIEYRPYFKDNLNRSYELALPRAKELGILLIHGTEITKGMPPGHLNALFIADANAIEDKDPRMAVQKAAQQGAFIIWNHPGWKAQQPDSTLWWDMHTDFYNQKQLHGIEVVGYESEYFPEAQRWAMDKNLTMVGATDIHPPIKDEFSRHGERRSMTIAFAKDRSLESLKEAFFAGRTIVYSGNKLYGKKAFLEPVFKASVSAKKAKLRNKKYVELMLHNSSDIPYEVVVEKNELLSCIKRIVLKPNATTLVQVRGISEKLGAISRLELPVTAKNMLVDVGKPLATSITIENDLEE